MSRKYSKYQYETVQGLISCPLLWLHFTVIINTVLYLHILLKNLLNEFQQFQVKNI